MARAARLATPSAALDHERVLFFSKK